MNFYQRYPGDYMRDTMHLSLSEHGAYSLLLDTYYATERPLPSDHESLFRICRAMTRPEQESVRKVADEFFPVNGDGRRHNRRADQEIAEAKPKIKAAQENGLRGGRPKNPTGTELKPTGFLDLVKNETQHEPTGLSTGTQQEPTGKAHQNQNHILNQNQTPEPETASGAQKRASAGSLAFSAYALAYRQRYHAEPVRNAKTNALFSQLVKRLGDGESPMVAAFYVQHNNVMYVRSGHAVDLLVRDAEKLRTEWATGHTITDTQVSGSRYKTIEDYRENLAGKT